MNEAIGVEFQFHDSIVDLALGWFRVVPQGIVEVRADIVVVCRHRILIRHEPAHFTERAVAVNLI